MVDKEVVTVGTSHREKAMKKAKRRMNKTKELEVRMKIRKVIPLMGEVMEALKEMDKAPAEAALNADQAQTDRTQ